MVFPLGAFPPDFLVCTAGDVGWLAIAVLVWVPFLGQVRMQGGQVVVLARLLSRAKRATRPIRSVTDFCHPDMVFPLGAFPPDFLL